MDLLVGLEDDFRTFLLYPTVVNLDTLQYLSSELKSFPVWRSSSTSSFSQSASAFDHNSHQWLRVEALKKFLNRVNGALNLASSL